MRRFVFLDRDGTLVHDPGYVHRLVDYQLLHGVEPALRRLQEAGFGLAIVTNQSGIGRGYFREDQFEAFQRHLVEDLARHGIRIEASFHCPHAPDAKCGCRKPAPGLFEQAHERLDADLAASWMIGDGRRDAEAAHAAGLAGAVWITDEEADPPPDCVIAPDLGEAVDRILG